MPPGALAPGWPCPANHSLFLHLCAVPMLFPTWDARLPTSAFRTTAFTLRSVPHATWHKALWSVSFSWRPPPGGAWTRSALYLGGATCMCYLECPSSQSPPFNSSSDVTSCEGFPWVPRQS